MTQNLAWYALGALAALVLVARLTGPRRAPSADPARRTRTVALTLGIACAALAPIVRLAPLAGLFNAAFGGNTAWLLSDTLWLCAGTLGVLWATWMRPDRPPTAPDLRAAVLHPRTLALLAVLAILWGAAWRDPAGWAALEPGTVNVGTDLGRVAARLAYTGYMAAFLLYFARTLGAVRAVLTSRAEYLRVSAAWLAVLIYLASPLLQAGGVLAQVVAPDPTRWPVISVVLQIVQGLAGVLMLFVLGPPTWTFAVLDRYILWEKARAQVALEHFHTWLEQTHAREALPGLTALHGAAREAALLAEIERATRRALAAAPTETRAAVAEWVEQGVCVAGSSARGARPVHAALVAALRTWNASAPGEAPLILDGDEDALVRFWGRVARAAVPTR